MKANGLFSTHFRMMLDRESAARKHSIFMEYKRFLIEEKLDAALEHYMGECRSEHIEQLMIELGNLNPGMMAKQTFGHYDFAARVRWYLHQNFGRENLPVEYSENFALVAIDHHRHALKYIKNPSPDVVDRSQFIS